MQMLSENPPPLVGWQVAGSDVLRIGQFRFQPSSTVRVTDWVSLKLGAPLSVTVNTIL